MKVIPVDKISTVSASSVNANYPAANLLDTHPKKLYKAEAVSTILTFSISAGSSGFMLFNTNADEVDFVLTDPFTPEWESGVEFESGVEWESGDTEAEITSITNLDGSDDGSCMAEWDLINRAITLTVTLTNTGGDYIQAGVAIAGKVYTYPGPFVGITEGVKDYSFVDEFNNGATYVKDRDIARTFNIKSNLALDTQFNEFMNDITKIVKSKPAGWFLTTGNKPRWLVYARFNRHMSGQHSGNDRSGIGFNLIEVL